ncbi:ring finger protein, putative [Ricinus communis]|uniref:RING-type E3 ubiquitin transferase n=1 Tax=Ricinus communis TaxID=3988 RepID=B9RXA6_RICCO|nr:ring finger protein, putative [Ricinus communis]|eukprot:XP_002518375.1 probable E3 ubiquitin-protein ligase ZFP1 [Ricinus communis]
MGQRNMLCTSQMIDLEVDRQGQGYLHPEPCILLGGVSNFPQSDIQTMVTASGSTTNIDAHRLPEHYDSAIFYGMPQYHGVQHHPQHHAPNLDLGVATASNFYVPYMTPSSGIPLSHGSCDHLPSSTSYGVIGVSGDEYGMNNHFMDNARGSYKRKNAEGNPGNFQYVNASAGSSSSVLSTRHPDGISLMDASSFASPQYRGNGILSIREVGSHRSVRNRSGATGLESVLAHSQNHFIQGNYIGQPFQPAGSLWADQHSSSSDAGTLAWNQNPAINYMHGNNVNGGSVETGSIVPQRYHELSSNRSNTTFLHPSPPNIRHHNFHHPLPPIQGMRGHNLNVPPQVSAASFRGLTSYASQSNVNPSQDGLDIGVRHPGSVQPTGLRIYRPHRDGVIPETTLRHRNLPHLRVLPTDRIAVLEFPDYYEVENYVDHHSDMRLDIEDMSYEELLALGERIGSVNTGLSEETIRSQLKTRKYLSSPMSINLEEITCMDQELGSCIICQDEYKSKEKIGTLDCGHEYHADCLKKWLRVKNVCPICKSEALPSVRKDV